MITRGIPEPQDPQWGCFEKDQAEALAALGHKVVCLSVDGRFRPYWRKLGTTHTTINGVEYYNWYMMPLRPLSMIDRRLTDKYIFHHSHQLFKKITKDHGKPDVIYAQWSQNMITGIRLREKYNIPVVGIEHAGRYGIDTKYHLFDTKYHLSKHDISKGEIVFRNINSLITVSNNLKLGIKQRFGADSTVVHNLVGGEFQYHEPIKHNRFAFISVGSLVYGKGFDIVIAALSKINSNTNITINIIGEGPERNSLQKLINENGLTNNVHLLGRKQKPEIVELMRQSDAFVFGTRHENFSVAILEALSQGLPSIVTDCGGARDCVDEKNGIIVDVDSVDQMAAAMQQMIDNIDKYNRQAIADDFQQKFSSESIAKQITNVLESAIIKYNNRQ